MPPVQIRFTAEALSKLPEPIRYLLPILSPAPLPSSLTRLPSGGLLGPLVVVHLRPVFSVALIWVEFPLAR